MEKNNYFGVTIIIFNFSFDYEYTYLGKNNSFHKMLLQTLLISAMFKPARFESDSTYNFYSCNKNQYSCSETQIDTSEIIFAN